MQGLLPDEACGKRVEPVVRITLTKFRSSLGNLIDELKQGYHRTRYFTIFALPLPANRELPVHDPYGQG
jgi:hypothetical protein